MDHAMKNADRQYDTTCRLSETDKAMMTSMSSCNRFGSSADNSPAKTSLSSTPKDTSFMTEEKLKKIYMPKKIEF